jgi:phosphoglycolate phosphatase
MCVDVAVLDVDGTVTTCPYDFDAMRVAVARTAAAFGVDAGSLGVHGIIEQMQEAERALGVVGTQFRREAEAAVEAIEVGAAPNSALIPGAARVLARLRRGGVAVALITRNCRAAADLVLKHCKEYDVLLTRNDVPSVKPHPDHVLASLAALGRRPERGVLVGDHAYDIQAGRAAGMRYCVGVRTGTGSEASLREAGADGVIDSIADLSAWLEHAAGGSSP